MDLGTSASLRDLFDRHDSDKGRKHSYDLVYEPALVLFRQQKISMLEIGMYRGASMRCWVDYFPHAHVFGVDIRPDFLLPENRVALEQSGRASIQFADSKKGNPFPGNEYDIVIDDGDHNLDGQRETFMALADSVKPGGLYFIEDVRKQCRYRQPDGSMVVNTPAKYERLLQSIRDRGFEVRVEESGCRYDDGSRCYVLVCSKRPRPEASPINC